MNRFIRKLAQLVQKRIPMTRITQRSWFTSICGWKQGCRLFRAAFSTAEAVNHWAESSPISTAANYSGAAYRIGWQITHCSVWSTPTQHVTITLHYLNSSFQRDATQCKGHRQVVVSHSPSLIPLSIYKWLFTHGLLRIQTSAGFQFDPVFHEQHIGSKSKIRITKMLQKGFFFTPHLSLLGNGQPKECA